MGGGENFDPILTFIKFANNHKYDNLSREKNHKNWPKGGGQQFWSAEILLLF